MYIHREAGGEANFMHTTGFLVTTTNKKLLKNSSLSRNFVHTERKRPGRGRIMLKEGVTRHDGDNTAWINIIWGNIMHCFSCSRRFAPDSNSHTPTAPVTAPSLSIRIKYTISLKSTARIFVALHVAIEFLTLLRIPSHDLGPDKEE